LQDYPLTAFTDAVWLGRWSIDLLTDAFFRRYEEVQLFAAFTEKERRFCGQVAQLLTKDLHKRDERKYKQSANDPSVKNLTEAHDRIARELGVTALSATRYEVEVGIGEYRRKQWMRYGIERIITNFLTAVPKDIQFIDDHMKRRISLVEQAFQVKAEELKARRQELSRSFSSDVDSGICDQLFDSIDSSHYLFKYKEVVLEEEKNFKLHIAELNERFRQAKIPLSYHNDLIQVSDDALIEAEIAKPFWAIVSDEKWANIDLQMKEALDERDRGERKAVSSAMNALESAIKSISNGNGWTTGAERGAASYIQNLVKVRGGVRFIEVWEHDALIKLFGDIRNAFGHGPASGQPLPTLRPEQTDWAIDTCMGWIKSLVRRS